MIVTNFILYLITIYAAHNKFSFFYDTLMVVKSFNKKIIALNKEQSEMKKTFHKSFQEDCYLANPDIPDSIY